eukprot:scaffold12521_cov108-Isochrysis_galbana.AAC.2
MGGEVFEGVGVGEGCVEEGEEHKQGEEAAVLVSEGVSWRGSGVYLGSRDSGSPQHSALAQSAKRDDAAPSGARASRTPSPRC